MVSQTRINSDQLEIVIWKLSRSKRVYVNVGLRKKLLTLEPFVALNGQVIGLGKSNQLYRCPPVKLNFVTGAGQQSRIHCTRLAVRCVFILCSFSTVISSSVGRDVLRACAP